MRWILDKTFGHKLLKHSNMMSRKHDLVTSSVGITAIMFLFTEEELSMSFKTKKLDFQWTILIDKKGGGVV